jgi:hypothetical protein
MARGLLYLTLLSVGVSTEELQKVKIVQSPHVIRKGGNVATSSKLIAFSEGTLVNFDVPKKTNARIGRYYDYDGIVFKNGRFIEDGKRAYSSITKGTRVMGHMLQAS